jgi:hypothetical protein
MKIILLFCEPRTGSNILCESMYMWKPIKVLWDFFVPSQTYKGFPMTNCIDSNILRDLYDSYKIDNSVDKLITCFQTNPSVGLQKLIDILEKNIVIKLHGWHFKELTLDNLLKIDNVEVIILQRTDLLQQYVSYHKAVIKGEWRNVNTTNMKISIDINEFLKFKEYTNNWYNQVLESCTMNNKIPLNLIYETDISNINNDSSILKCKINEWANIVNLNLIETEYVPNRIIRQDYSNPKDSIINWDDIKYQL